ncbi:MAG: TIGR04283 family arsenosugar biosynthesis glycosyltransferase [Acidobacteriota bacterium]
MPTITVAAIVPTLDEEHSIQALLPELVGVADEVIVSDGGSHDGTVAVSKALGALVVEGRPGRGPQLNRGAAAASSDIFVFLHADTHLPRGGIDQIRLAISAGGVGGGFHIRFDHPTPIFGLGSRIVNLRTSLTRAPLGDQAQFVSRSAFERLAGFRDWPILEDVDFIRRLRKLGEIAIIESPALTSARRFVQGGITATIANNWLIFGLYFLGASPDRLSRLYRRVR